MNSEFQIESIFIEFINEFVTKGKRERLLQFFNKKKNYWKIINEFHTSAIFDNKVLIEIQPRFQYSTSIYQILTNQGAGEECFSLLDYLRDEKYKCNLKDKLVDSVGFLYETVIYCPNSKTGYFEGGHAKDRYILMKK